MERQGDRPMLLDPAFWAGGKKACFLLIFNTKPAIRTVTGKLWYYFLA